MSRAPRDQKERFDEKWMAEPMSGCWLWTAQVDRDGYGRVRIHDSRRWLAARSHRAAWLIYRGPISAGKFVLHACDNPSCVNPDHLTLGTHRDNMSEMRSRNRQAVGDRVAISRLTSRQVREIRRRLATLERHATIAQDFGVTHRTISDIHLGRTWRHLRDA